MSEGAEALAGQQQQQQAPSGEGQQQQAPSGDGQQQQAPQIPAWLTGLPDDYRADPDINRYQSVEDLVKGMKETRAWARGRVPIPTAESDDATWQEFGAKLRAEKPDDYEIPVPEGMDTTLAERFKAFAHETGIPPRWAKGIAEFNNTENADRLSKLSQGNKDEITALELELGNEAYNRRLEATNSMLRAMGVSEDESFDVVTALQTALGADGKPGAGKALKLLFGLAERTGELAKVDPTDVSLRMGAMSGERAQGEIDRLASDADFMAKAKVAGSPEARKWNDLNAAVATAQAKRR